MYAYMCKGTFMYLYVWQCYIVYMLDRRICEQKGKE
jgi:hypothetical protein